MKTAAACYEPSGFFRPTAILLTLAAAAAGVALAWLYVLAVQLIPWIQLDLLATAGFGALLGLLLKLALTKGHCRNRLLALVLALLGRLVPLAASYWWSYQSTLSKVKADGGGDFTMRQGPQVRRKIGWTITNGSHRQPTSDSLDGWQVDAVWTVEALIVLGIVLGMGYTTAQQPYCESCNEWGVRQTLAIGGRARGDVAELIEQGNVDGLLALTRTEGGDTQALAYGAHPARNARIRVFYR